MTGLGEILGRFFICGIRLLFVKYRYGSRTYFPDFYLPNLDLYIEVKGYERERDLAKWSQFPEKLIVLKKQEIEEIKKGTFSGLC